MILAVALVLLFWTLWFAWPYIRRWLMRRGMNYVQDRMYKSMGIDPAQMRQAQREAREGLLHSRLVTRKAPLPWRRENHTFRLWRNRVFRGTHPHRH